MMHLTLANCKAQQTTVPINMEASTVRKLTSGVPLPTKNEERYLQPHKFTRRILLAVTGLSPQVVTETLYALAVAPAHGKQAFVPTEIHLVTTVEGAERARLMLFEHEGGRFYRLCEEYGLDRGAIQFDPQNIHVVVDGNGRPLQDIVDEAGSAAVADLITEMLRNFTSDADCAIHASIAGGRKTMGFYLGYALSLYGRTQDRLSHVLVSAPFESDHQFYYPPSKPTTLIIKDRPVRTDEARILLADIPFVRLRDSLPDELLADRGSFSQAVAEAQRALPPIALKLYPERREVEAGGETFTLKPVEFAFYWMLAERASQGRPGLHWSDDGLTDELLGYVAKLVNPDSGDYEKTESAYRRRYTKENFDPTKTHVNNAIKKALGVRRAQHYLVSRQELIPGTRFNRSGLNLPAESITIEHASLRVRTGFQKQDKNSGKENE